MDQPGPWQIPAMHHEWPGFIFLLNRYVNMKIKIYFFFTKKIGNFEDEKKTFFQ